jgi:hypothetical protein
LDRLWKCRLHPAMLRPGLRLIRHGPHQRLMVTLCPLPAGRGRATRSSTGGATASPASATLSERGGAGKDNCQGKREPRDFHTARPLATKRLHVISFLLQPVVTLTCDAA